MIRRHSVLIQVAVVLAVALSSAAAMAQEAALDTEELQPLRDRITVFFEKLTDKTKGGPERAVREIIGNTVLKYRNDDITKIVDQAAGLDERYGVYVGHEEASMRRVGKDLVFLRYLYKGERFPVVWYFTFYRPGNGRRIASDSATSPPREWMLIGLRFDSKLDALDR